MLVGIVFKTLFALALWFWILPSFLRWKSLPLFFLIITLAMGVSMTLEVVTSWQFQIFTLHHMVNHPSPAVWLNLVIYLVLTLVMLAIFFGREWIRNERQKRQLIESQLTTELDFLRAQINPHFLFNTLNNLFSIAQKNRQDELSSGISKLSGLMRYMIYDSRVNLVPLSREIEYLEDFIGLARLRYSEDEVSVKFLTEGAVESKMIAPMILLPFVENAFKHGVQIDQKSEIDVSIRTGEHDLVFTCRNPAGANHQNDHSGIGLENVRRRLLLLYPGRHDLVIENGTRYFSVTLTIRQ